MSEKADEAARARREQKIQRQLDEALADSFPASDPVSIVTSTEEEDWGGDRANPGASEKPTAPAKPEG
jgi:hypothetical protein